MPHRFAGEARKLGAAALALDLVCFPVRISSMPGDLELEGGLSPEAQLLSLSAPCANVVKTIASVGKTRVMPEPSFTEAQP
jgi:hypothetical protein